MLFTLQLLLFAVIAQAQLLSPVKFTSQLKTNGTAVAEIVFSGKIQPGWHVYSTGLGSDGPISATFNVNKMEGVELVGKLQARGNEVSKYDNMFGMKLRFFEGSATFVQKVKFTAAQYVIDAYLEYGACNDQSCLPPSEVNFKHTGKAPAIDSKAALEAKTDNKQDAAMAAKAKADSIAMMQAALTDTAQQNTLDSTALAQAAEQLDTKALWQPVVKSCRRSEAPTT